MALFKIDKTYFDTFTVRTAPKRTFTSSSKDGITGDISVFPLASVDLKEVITSHPGGTAMGDDEIQYPEVIRQTILSDFVDSEGLLNNDRATKTQSGMELSPSQSQAMLETYMDAVNKQSVTVKNRKTVEVLRFEPSFKFTSDTCRKLTVQNVLMPYYRPKYGEACNWAFTNYHSLNFFTAPNLPNKAGLKGSSAKVFSSIPKQSALIYPFVSQSNRARHRGTIKASSLTGSCYRPSTAFSFEFWINPRYGQPIRNQPYHAGTLFHASSSFAISLVSGSSKDGNGLVDKFRILLQLSAAAEIPPSSCSLEPNTSLYLPHGPGNPALSGSAQLIFSSSDNSLSKNTWHHVCIRWGNTVRGELIEAGTGSFIIDGIEQGTFDLGPEKLTGGSTPKSIRQDNWDGPGPCALFIGNFYEGPNGKTSPDDSYISQFFNPARAHSDGLVNMYPGVAAGDKTGDMVGLNRDPQRAGGPKPGSPNYNALNSFYVPGYALDHPLQAEVHELKIYGQFKTLTQIKNSMERGPDLIFGNNGEMYTDDLLFYVPPFFLKNTKVRDVLQTPFQTARGTTNDPFNVPLAFGIGGHYLNLENFTKDLVTGEFPRLLNLSGSEIETPTGWLSCNDFLYATGSVAKRNLTILPNDNGRFMPNFDILVQDAMYRSNRHGARIRANPQNVSASLSLFVDDWGRRNLTLISLKNLLTTGSEAMGTGIEDSVASSIGLGSATPSDPSIPSGSILTIFNRTRDATSDQVSFFDASNLFYGDTIEPLSYSLIDDNLTGSNGSIGITLKDNGKGLLHRADCSGSHATWNNVGTVFYDEGLSVVKAPTLPRFGSDQFKVSMTGKRNIYVLQISIPAPAGSLDLSTNASYSELAPSHLPADEDETFTYLTNLNFLDENLNVICKSNFSQAIVKRINDRMMVRIRLDF